MTITSSRLKFDLKDVTISSTATVQDAMNLIDTLGSGFCFVTNESFQLLGVVTDGDIRRFIMAEGTLNESILLCCSEHFIVGKAEESYEELMNKLSGKIKILPIVDNAGVLVSFVSRFQSNFIPILEPKLGIEEFTNVYDCLESGWISSGGHYVQQFEEEFSCMHEGRDCVAVSNGTVALHLALITLGIQSGDEVIVPSLTFAATAAAVLHAGATPVLCECDESLCIDPAEIDALITPKTKAVILVHLYGRVAKVDAIQKVIEGKRIYLIEDTAEALGSSLNGKYAGTFGDASTFSFFGNKTITTGEGGMVSFRDSKHAEQSRILRDHGMSKTKRYWHDVVGYNYRMTNLQAAIGVAQLRKLPSILKSKRDIFIQYKNHFINHSAVCHLSSERAGETNSNWLFCLILKDTIDIEDLMSRLNTREIDSRRIFYPLHQMPPYSSYKTSASMDRTVCASKNGICLPSSATLGKDEIIRVTSVMDEELERI